MLIVDLPVFFLVLYTSYFVYKRRHAGDVVTGLASLFQPNEHVATNSSQSILSNVYFVLLCSRVYLRCQGLVCLV